tara:strand:+ start:403 stop:636 length:234 start_codon:yes stop_codon:yes gene_type:complete
MQFIKINKILTPTRASLCKNSFANNKYMQWKLYLVKKYEKLAGAAGFEPANAGIKSRCLTAWRRPKTFYLILKRANH